MVAAATRTMTTATGMVRFVWRHANSHLNAQNTGDTQYPPVCIRTPCNEWNIPSRYGLQIEAIFHLSDKRHKQTHNKASLLLLRSLCPFRFVLLCLKRIMKINEIKCCWCFVANSPKNSAIFRVAKCLFICVHFCINTVSSVNHVICFTCYHPLFFSLLLFFVIDWEVAIYWMDCCWWCCYFWCYWHSQ